MPYDKKKYRENNKDKIKEYNKKYYEENKKNENERTKKYREENKEKCTQLCKEYKQTDRGKKSRRIKDWKRRGLICEDYDKLYEHYLNTSECDNCGIELVEGMCGANKRCMDHSHKTGLFRNILCHSCNIMRPLYECD